jgi:hypothetical protein
VARDVEILLIEDKDYTVLASAKTDAAYTFKAPAAEYHVVALGDKAHVASLSSVDIW